MRAWRARLQTAARAATAAVARREQPIEAFVGLSCVTIGVGMMSLAAAFIVFGSVVFAFSLVGGRQR